VDERVRDRLVFHGAVVILLGLAAGFPYGLVVTGSLVSSERAWRMAHLEGVLNGLLLLAVAGVSGRLALTERRAAILAWSLVVTAYGNLIASVLAATANVRGLAPGGSLANTITYLLFMVAVVAVVMALVLVAHGARRTSSDRT
jgi:uncharacterized membrane protein